jgi:uracil phosphoribosyltransferase
MATMAMSLRVVVPPHPLIGHWLSVLRDRHTPAPLYGSATTELGRWLTYEALRYWLPETTLPLDTGLAQIEGQVVNAQVPVLACVLGNAALGLWDGARPVLPSARVLHLDPADPQLPADLDAGCGVLVFAPELASGASMQRLLDRLQERGFSGERVRVITALCCQAALKRLGEAFEGASEEFWIYTGCIDAELNGAGRIVPGIGVVEQRLFGGLQLEAAGTAA